MQHVSRRRGGAWPARPLWSREGGPGSNGRKMAALKEDQSYGLSCGRVSDGSKVSVFHVKLTDSALRAFETYRASQVSGVAVGDVGVPAGLACPLARRPGLGARGPAFGVLFVDPLAVRVRESRSSLVPGGDTGDRPRPAEGPELARLIQGGVCVAPGGARNPSLSAQDLPDPLARGALWAGWRLLRQSP